HEVTVTGEASLHARLRKRGRVPTSGGAIAYPESGTSYVEYRATCTCGWMEKASERAELEERILSTSRASFRANLRGPRTLMGPEAPDEVGCVIRCADDRGTDSDGGGAPPPPDRSRCVRVPQASGSCSICRTMNWSNNGMAS